MSKSNRNTATTRRALRPDRAQRPYKPIPVVTEQFRGKEKIDEESQRRSFMEGLKAWGRRIRGWFGRKKKRRIETVTIKSKWRKQSAFVSQEERDRGIRKSRIKASNRRKRRDARALHQMERRRA
jgi:hypothetical protein